jgi:hypothetical protein
MQKTMSDGDPIPSDAGTQDQNTTDKLNTKRKKDREKSAKCYAKKKAKGGTVFNDVAC